MKTKTEFTETPFYKSIVLPDKDLWVQYFAVLYNEKDIFQEKFTIENRNEVLKSIGLKGENIQLCINGLDGNWNDLLNGFLRHYHSMVYVELCMAMHAYSGLIEMQMRPAKDQKEQALKVDGLEDFKRVRQLINALQKELFNNKHGDLGNVIAGSTLFKGTRVETNAQERTKKRLTIKDAASQEYE